jgi:CubicO group peptidase (beta-lactamase class C family)
MLASPHSIRSNTCELIYGSGLLKEFEMKIRIKTFYVLSFTFLCLPLSVIGQDSFVKSAAVDSAVAEQMKQQRLVGVAIGIIQNSTVVYTKGYRFSNFERRTPVNESSVFTGLPIRNR